MREREREREKAKRKRPAWCAAQATNQYTSESPPLYSRIQHVPTGIYRLFRFAPALDTRCNGFNKIALEIYFVTKYIYQIKKVFCRFRQSNRNLFYYFCSTRPWDAPPPSLPRPPFNVGAPTIVVPFGSSVRFSMWTVRQNEPKHLFRIKQKPFRVHISIPSQQQTQFNFMWHRRRCHELFYLITTNQNLSHKQCMAQKSQRYCSTEGNIKFKNCSVSLLRLPSQSAPVVKCVVCTLWIQLNVRTTVHFRTVVSITFNSTENFCLRRRLPVLRTPNRLVCDCIAIWIVIFGTITTIRIRTGNWIVNRMGICFALIVIISMYPLLGPVEYNVSDWKICARFWHFRGIWVRADHGLCGNSNVGLPQCAVVCNKYRRQPTWCLDAGRSVSHFTFTFYILCCGGDPYVTITHSRRHSVFAIQVRVALCRVDWVFGKRISSL